MKKTRMLIRYITIIILAALVQLSPQAVFADTPLPSRPAAFIVREVGPYSKTALSLPFEPFYSDLSEQMMFNLTGGLDEQSADAIMTWDSEIQQYITVYKCSTNALWYDSLDQMSLSDFNLELGSPFWLSNVQDMTQVVAFGGLLPPLSVLASNNLDVFSIVPSVFYPGYNLFSTGSAFPNSLNPANLIGTGATASSDPLGADRVHSSLDQFSYYLSPLDGGYLWRNSSGGQLDPPLINPASAWWYNHTGTNIFTLPSISMPESGWPLGSMGIMDVQLAVNNTAILSVYPPENESSVLAVLYQDNPQALSDLTSAKWKVLAENICSEQGAAFTLVDSTAASNKDEGDIRLYLVIRTDTDEDGDGLADDIEKFVTGTDKSVEDTDGDDINDGEDQAPLSPSPAGVDPVKTVFWLKADDSVVDADGKITEWASVSTNALSFTPSYIARAPLFIEDSDGISFARFDGGNDSLHSQLSSGGDPLTLICVSRFDSDGQLAAYENCLFHCGDRTETAGSMSFCRGSSNDEFRFYTLYGPDDSRSYGPVISEKQWQVTSIEWAGASRSENSITVNGIQRVIEQNTPVSLSELQMTLGAMHTTGIQTTDNMQGDIAEIILLRGDVTLAELSAVESYLACKYNINEKPVIETEEYVIAPLGSNTVEITAVVTDDSMPSESLIFTSLELVSETCQPVIEQIDEVDQVDGLTRIKTFTWKLSAQYAGSCQLILTATDGESECSLPVNVLFRDLSASSLPQEGLKLWLRADAVTATNNAPVTEWRNIADTSSLLIQDAPQFAPVFKVNGYNGLPVVSFDGTDDWMRGSFNSETMPLTVITVMKYAHEFQPDGDFECVYTIRDNDTPLTRMTMGRNRGNLGSPNCYAYWLIDGSSPRFGPTLTGGVWQVFNTVHTTASPKHTLSINGYPQIVQDNTKNLSHKGDIEIGRLATQLSGKHYFNGDIAELLVYERTLSESELAQIGFYLSHRYNLWSGRFDLDADGIVDTIEQLLAEDLDPLPVYSLPFVESFETGTIPVQGCINGQNGWHTLSNTIASTQSDIVSEGNRALQMKVVSMEGEDPKATVVHPFAAEDVNSVVWMDMDVYVMPGKEPDDDFVNKNSSAAIFYFKSSRKISVYDGSLAAGSCWVDYSFTVNETSQWARVTIALDYNKQEWLLCVNGTLIATDLGFSKESYALSSLTFTGRKGLFDNIVVDTQVPAGISADGDTLEDRWELEVFGHLDFDEDSDPDGDELSIEEEFAIGTKPDEVDSDGDGVPDGQAVSFIAGVDTSARYIQHITRNYTEAGDSLVWPDSTAISCAYDLSVQTPGFHILEIEAHNYQYTPPSDSSFEFRVSINGCNIGSLKVPCMSTPARGRLVTPWLPEGIHRFKISWVNRVVDGTDISRPALDFIRLIEMDGADDNDDGLQDWMQEILLSSASDTDGDGINDADEVLIHNSNTLKQDSDGDGLSDLEELALGTSLVKSDTDDDYVSDFDELYSTYTDPLSMSFGGSWTPVVVKNGSEFDCTEGRFYPDSKTDSLIAHARGVVEYLFDLPEDEKPVLRLTGQHGWCGRTNTAPITVSDFLVYADEQFVGRYFLRNEDGSFDAVLPFLNAGSHRIRIVWNAVDARIWLRITQVGLGSLGGEDVNNDGIADWIENSAAYTNFVFKSVVESPLSPVCIEGAAKWPGLVSAATGDSAVTVHQAVSGSWYADVDLPASGMAALTEFSFENGACISGVSVAWTPLDLVNGVTNLNARLGDTLRIGTPLGGVASLTAANASGTLFDSATVADPVEVLLSVPGEWLFTTVWTPEEGVPQTRILTVNVYDGSFPAEVPACQVGRSRNWSIINNTPGTVVETASGLEVSLSGSNVTLNATAMYKDHGVLLRAGIDGPVLDSCRVAPFWIQTAVDSYMSVVETQPDYQIWGTRLVTLGVPPDVDIELRVIVSGVTFDDLSLVRRLSGSDLFEAAEYSYRLIHPDWQSASACHTIISYQGGENLGAAYISGIGLPVDLRPVEF